MLAYSVPIDPSVGSDGYAKIATGCRAIGLLPTRIRISATATRSA